MSLSKIAGKHFFWNDYKWFDAIYKIELFVTEEHQGNIFKLVMYSKLDTCLDNCHDPNLIEIRSLLRSENLTVTVQRLSDFQSVTKI